MAFWKVAEHRGFTAAAAELEVSPSALSQAIRQLEARLGVRLFNRTTRSVSLTDAGPVAARRLPGCFTVPLNKEPQHKAGLATVPSLRAQRQFGQPSPEHG